MTEILEIQEIQVNFEPAIINVADREEFEATIKNYVGKFEGYIVTPETFKDDKKLLAALRKALKSIDEKRKEIKNDFNKPLVEFETWVKESSESLNNLINDVDTQVKQYETEQKRKRKEAIYFELKEQSAKQNIDYRIFENFMDDWNKATNFNEQLKPKKVLKDSIKFVIEQERLKQEEIKKNKKNISSFAFMSGISDTPYIRMYDDGKEVSEILEIMNEDIAKDKARKEAEEAQRKVEEQKRQELVNQQLQKDFNGQDERPQVQEEKLSERVLPEEVETPSKSEKLKKRYRATIEIEFESLEDKDRWKRCMMANGFGEFKATDFKEIK